MDLDNNEDNSITLEDLSNPLENIKSRLSPNENNIILRSVIPKPCKSNECIVGIDEAGRGPVLGNWK